MIELHDFSIGYGERTLLCEVEATIEKGKLTALIGRNGTGKSTLLRAIAGLNHRYAGRILLDGHHAADMRAAEMSKNTGIRHDRAHTHRQPQMRGRRGYRPRTLYQLDRKDAEGRHGDRYAVARLGGHGRLCGTHDGQDVGRRMPAHHDRTRPWLRIHADYSARRTHLVPRYAQPLRIVYAAGTAGA